MHGRAQVKLEEGVRVDDDNDLSLLMTNLLHAADISSTGREPELYWAWAQRVFLEFFEQGALQKERDQEVAPFMDAETADIPSAQKGFLKYIGEPLFFALCAYA